MGKIGYGNFFRIFRVNDPKDWVPGLDVKIDSVWVIPARPDDMITDEEFELLNDHPELDLLTVSL